VLRLNGFLIDDNRWDGQVPYTVEHNAVPNRVLRDGENLLTLYNPGDTDAGEVDQVALNWLEVTYWRPFTAVDDLLSFEGVASLNGPGLYVLHGFTTPEVEMALVQLVGAWSRWILKSCSKERPFSRIPNATAGTCWVVKCGRTKLCTTQ